VPWRWAAGSTRGRDPPRIGLAEQAGIDHLAFDWPLVWAVRHHLAAGAGVTVALAGIALAVSIVPSALIAVGREYGPRTLAGALATLVTLVRGIPAPVGLVFVFFALPFVGITLAPFAATATILVCIQVAYLSEVIRGGLKAVGRGQVEAARTLGLGFGATLLHVVGPQSLRVATPAFASSVVQLVHNTTIASLVTLPDLLGEALDAQSIGGNPSALLVVVPIYWSLLLPLTWIARRFERRLATGETWIASRTSS
jgi:polar amino acid transport system permease protein